MVEDGGVLLEVTCDMLSVAGRTATPASSVAAERPALEAHPFDAVLTDVDVAARGDGSPSRNTFAWAGRGPVWLS